MNDGLGWSLPHSKQEELAADKVKSICFPGDRRFISGNPTAQMTHRLVEKNKKCPEIKLLPFFHLSHHCNVSKRSSLKTAVHK